MEGVRGQFCGGSLGTAEEKRRVGTGIWTAFGTTDPLSFAGGERISRETGRNSGSALRHFYRGKLPDENEPAVAVIGARECSEYGRYVAEELGQYLGRAGIQVISGMARGIDGISQQAALSAGGTSYGVLGCGVDICYPAQNRRLYEELLEKGGLLSTYAPGTKPLPQHFPPRNRIVSGLSDALIVIEARQKSGTLITVDMALEQGRDVYVVPGRLTDRLSDGCNHLLTQGAGVFLSPESFAEDFCGAGRKNRDFPQMALEERTGGKIIGKPAEIRQK